MRPAPLFARALTDISRQMISPRPAFSIAIALLTLSACGGSAEPPMRVASDRWVNQDEVVPDGPPQIIEPDVAPQTPPVDGTTPPLDTAIEPEAPTGEVSAPETSNGWSDDATVPLSAASRALLSALPSENIPAPDQFYYRTNERRHELLVPHLRGLGGALVGVGADQCYTLAVIARSSLIFAVDYDRRVPKVHAMYSVLVPASESVAALIARFEPGARRQTEALLREGLTGDESVDSIVRTYSRTRQDLHAYLLRVQRRNASWLSDEESYAYVRALFQSGRVIARTGDVTGEETLRRVGATARELGVPVRMVYFSNAEQFFRYSGDFVTNMQALPVDDRSVVVRTFRHRSIPNAERDNWHYLVHEFADFRERVESGAYPRLNFLIGDLARARAPFLGEGISTMTRQTPRFALERRQASN